MRYVLGHLNVAEQLVDKGAKINVTNNNGLTPLHFAGLTFALSHII